MTCGRMSLTFRFAKVIPLFNFCCTSKEEMVLVRRTFTVGLVTTVSPLSIMATQLIQAKY